MSKRILVIDSLNLFLRSYIVNPTMSKDGNPIGGTIGFIASLQKLMREIKPDVIVACWDGRDGSRKRKQANKNYKAGRSPVRLNRNFKMLNEAQEQENKIWQMHRIFEYLNNFPIIQLVADEVEADDIISYITRYSCFKEDEKVIVSSDKDFYQLLDENTILHRPIQKQYLNKFHILEEHGIHPTNFALARAMVGDKSDNLVGVPGVGLKTVAKRFVFFAEDRDVTIPELIEFCSNQESKVKAFQSIIDNEELIKDNYSLMQLYSPSLSIQTKQRIDWSIDEFDFEFNKTETDLMMITDGIADNHWSDLFQGFKRMCWKKK
jgi:5'-3' exonuclease